MDFVDTNVLLYAFDSSEVKKHPIADALVRSLVIGGTMVLSSQVLNEFFWNATRPHRPAALTSAQAETAITGFVKNAQVVPMTSDLTLDAIRLARTHPLSFWDALIVAAAKKRRLQPRIF